MDPLGSWGREVSAHRKRERFSRQKKTAPPKWDCSGKHGRRILRCNPCCFTGRSDRSGNLTGTQTPGTNIYMAGRTVYNCLYALHIGLPRTIGASVGVRHLNTERNTLIAKLALSHPLHLLAGNLDLPHKKSICRQLLYISTTRLEKQAFFHQKFCFFTKKLENKKSASAAGRKGCAKREGLI